MTTTEAYNLTVNPPTRFVTWCEETGTEISQWFDGETMAAYWIIKGSDGRGIEKSSNGFSDTIRLTTDWALNFMARPLCIKVKGKRVLVSRGMYKKWESIACRIESEFVKAQKNGYKIILGGFSQGGGCCYVGALLLNAYLPGLVDEFVLLAPQKTVTAAEKYFENVNVFYGDKDLVPKVAPWFKHYGKIEIVKSQYGIFDVYKNHMSYGKM